MDVDAVLSSLEAEGNLRVIPSDVSDSSIDFTSNDYLGFGGDACLREDFFGKYSPSYLLMTSSASRLLAGHQAAYTSLERVIGESYGRDVLIFNSGYHANTGIIGAIAGRSSLILADRLVHASIIDGIILSGAPFRRFNHNDLASLEKLVEENITKFKDIIIVVESVYSMDGDRADLARIAALKKRFPSLVLYVDEAHAVGVCGPAGLGEAVASGSLHAFDVVVGTFGKALASAGAYAVVGRAMRSFLINKARSLIFSTALPPAQILWTEHVWRHSLAADSARDALGKNVTAMAEVIPGPPPSHIRPLVAGDSARAVQWSKSLAAEGFNVLPIRRPTVPTGTERLRFSLSASISLADILRLKPVLERITTSL